MIPVGYACLKTGHPVCRNRTVFARLIFAISLKINLPGDGMVFGWFHIHVPQHTCSEKHVCTGRF
jgi:hypothetical protein